MLKYLPATFGLVVLLIATTASAQERSAEKQFVNHNDFRLHHTHHTVEFEGAGAVISARCGFEFPRAAMNCIRLSSLFRNPS